MVKATELLFRGRWWATAMLLLCLGQILWWAFERTPPFKLLTYSVEHPIFPGGPLKIVLNVERDLTRRCSVHIERYVTDGKGYRMYFPTLDLSHSALVHLELNSPGVNKILLMVPQEAHPGLSAYGNMLSYACNPVHKIWPMVMTYEIPFRVSPL